MQCSFRGLEAAGGMIVGWQIASLMCTDLVLDALEMAAWRRVLLKGCVQHSDAGRLDD